MALSVFDLFKVGIGPSSSHTVGPMRAAQNFCSHIDDLGKLQQVKSIKAELFGSLGATGKGHGSDTAVILGLCGELPESIDPDTVSPRLKEIEESHVLSLLGVHPIKFIANECLTLHKRKSLPYHANGMKFTALDAGDNELHSAIFYSIGGGFIIDESAAQGDDPLVEEATEVPYPFTTANELLTLCDTHGLSISTLMLENEKSWRSENEIRHELLHIWSVMQACVERGCNSEGVLPGGLKVRRRAAAMYRKLRCETTENTGPLATMDWVNLYALAVNEENAVGGRVVTAPTNGAAGIVPAVMHYFANHCQGADDDSIVRFLLAAAAIGILFKLNASISGAEVGCQGEVGSACSMAAAGLTEVLGGSPEQVENAAEIGIEHNLGLTCDPIGGLVQVPCIERNAMGAVKAINASRMAMRGDGRHFVSLDKAIKTMRETGKDMKTKYKETARGGLAINVIEVPVSVVEC